MEVLDCEGSIITIDAMGCQKAIVGQIIDQKADYLLALKQNQGALFEQISEFMEKNKLLLPRYE